MDTDPDCPDTPDFRVTVRRDGSIRLVDWGPWLATSGPMYTLLEARGRAGVAIADLTAVREDEIAAELVVEFRCGGDHAHREALLGWARRVGYRRVWFDRDVIELEPGPTVKAETRCSGCRVRLVDAGPDFWLFVRARGAFPSVCALCGSDLPQWWPAARRQTRHKTSDSLGMDKSESHPERSRTCS